MATAWSEIITAAMQVIDDIRWQEQLTAVPAQFYASKCDTVRFALPLLRRPPELLEYLQSDVVQPAWLPGEWISTQESLTGATEIQSGFLGGDLFDAAVRSADGLEITPYSGATYDPATGIITFPQQTEAGVEYQWDIFTDGSFPDLTQTQMRLFGLAIAVVWDERFERSFIDLTPKIHDSSFSTVNEANYIEKSNRRLLINRQSFEDELRGYEQDCAYATVVANRAAKTTLV